jgi:hypothetical protein
MAAIISCSGGLTTKMDATQLILVSAVPCDPAAGAMALDTSYTISPRTTEEGRLIPHPIFM